MKQEARSLIAGNIFNAPFILEREAELRALAKENIKADKGFSGPETFSAEPFEMLKLMNDYDLAGVIIRWKLMKEIESKKLHTVLPGGYSYEEALEIHGKLSRTKQSIITNLVEHIFPYCQSELGITPQALWQDIGQSNLADALPYLRVIITDEPSKRASVNEAAERIYEDVDKVGGYTNQAERKRMAVRRVLAAAEGTNQDLRKSIRSEPEEILNVFVLKRNGTRYLLAEVTDKQYEVFTSKLKDLLDVSYVDLEKEDVWSLPPVRQIVGG